MINWQKDMIPRFRIHRAQNCLHRLFLVILFTLLLPTLLPGRAGAEPVIELATQSTTDSSSEEGGVSWFPSIPLHITLGLDVGYDDNVTASANGEGAWFTSENIGLSYDRSGERTEIQLLANAGLRQFFDAKGTQDVDANITLALSHKVSTRLSFAANAFASYQTEPDFETNVGPETVRSNYFETTDLFSVSYYWLPRFATITNYTFRRIKYDDLSIGIFQDRIENTLGEVFQFSRSRRTNLFAEYRFEVIDYDTAPTDSTTHYVLAGINHKLTEHLTLDVRGGETFRSVEFGQDTVNPRFESSLNYTKSERSTLVWTTSYGVEESNSRTVGLETLTFRTGLLLNYGLSARISSTVGVYYNRAENTDPFALQSGSEVSQDSLELVFSLRYAINPRFGFHIDYNRTSVKSTPGSPSDYSRNRYSTGLSFKY